jgi:hypothetical protein
MLVEDAVVGEELLAVDASHLALRADEAGVEEVALEPRRADEHCQVPARAGDVLDRVSRSPNESGPQQQILGRISRDRELGKDQEIGSLLTGVVDGFDDPVPIPLEVADDGVELCQRESQLELLIEQVCDSWS